MKVNRNQKFTEMQNKLQLLALAISGVLSVAHNRAYDLECYYQSKFDSEISDTRKCDTSGHHNPICFSLQLPDNKYERGCIGAEEVMKDYPTEKGCKGEVSEFIRTQLENQTLQLNKKKVQLNLQYKCLA